MRRFYLIFIFLYVSYSGVMSNDADLSKAFLTTDNPKLPKSFKKIFNGKDFSNWHGVLKPPYDNPYKRNSLIRKNRDKFLLLQKRANILMNRHWLINNDILSFDGKGFSIATDKKYGDFELYVSWKISSNSDSGLYLKGTPQIQIWDVNSKSSQKIWFG